MSITAKELSKILCLSEAAISMALNNKQGVSTKTRKKVIETAKEFGYDFSKINDIVSNDTQNGTIHFVIIKKSGAIVSETPFFSELTEGITTTCHLYNYFIDISYLYNDEDFKSQLTTILNYDCKGIILLGTELSESDFLPFKDIKIPIVILDTNLENIHRNYVMIDNVSGALLATNYLISKCKTQPGYLKSNITITNFTERADGFYKALRKNGLPVSKSIVHLLSPSIEGSYSDMKDLLLQGETPCGCYFADNDLIATGAIKAFKELGYRVPEDISVIGFDNMPHCSYADPPLTTINVPKFQMGKVAAKRLLELLNDPTSEPTKTLICTTLVKRNSIIN